ncbi:ABC transporter ATP-binding protein [Fulvivirgaceae bacterium PWU20]|uniref:ABC transporter ATP-binding protein n=1 Tax=Chryseosolibacter indicus TaxID=2782351 RepID=A0ABS5VTY6_9BACT|nr:ABC transporter ATP-binding protein [Chryseosolibacter indicus]
MIEVKNLSKKFVISHEAENGKYTALRDVMVNKMKGLYKTSSSIKEDFWALKDLTFNINQGDRVGVVGRNGAGKSTLLKILSRITEPTAGSIRIRGRVASLLEVGTGFHPELTGRENIFLNGSILGMKRSEIRKKFDEIVSFAEVEKFLDTPVKRYSSGMYVRLAFSVAAHLEPEILVIDEVLAVGDAQFQKKCLGKMEDVSKGEGRTVLFVSHNIGLIQNLCNRGILLERGVLVKAGEISEILTLYNSNNSRSLHWEGLEEYENIQLTSTSVETLEGTSGDVYNDEDIFINIRVKINQPTRELLIGFNLLGLGEKELARANYNDFNGYNTLDPGSYLLIFCIPKHTLATGTYAINFDIAIPYVKKINSNKPNLYFEVLSRGEKGNKYFVTNSSSYNSIIRPDWLKSIEKIG